MLTRNFGMGSYHLLAAPHVSDEGPPKNSNLGTTCMLHLIPIYIPEFGLRRGKELLIARRQDYTLALMHD